MAGPGLGTCPKASTVTSSAEPPASAGKVFQLLLLCYHFSACFFNLPSFIIDNLLLSLILLLLLHILYVLFVLLKTCIIAPFLWPVLLSVNTVLLLQLSIPII